MENDWWLYCVLLRYSARCEEQARLNKQQPLDVYATCSLGTPGKVNQSRNSMHNTPDEEDAEEIPSDLSHLSPEEQQKRIRNRAFILMVCGTLLLLLFTGPMVDAMSELGDRTVSICFWLYRRL